MNMGDYDNRTALHLSCAENHLACVKFLIETCKVDIDVQDRWGNTPFQEAQRFHRPRVVALLKREMAKRSMNVPVISEEDLESVGGSVKLNDSKEDKNEARNSVKCNKAPTISINGQKYDQVSEMAASTIQGAFKKMRQRKVEVLSDVDGSKPDVITM